MKEKTSLLKIWSLMLLFTLAMGFAACSDKDDPEPPTPPTPNEQKPDDPKPDNPDTPDVPFVYVENKSFRGLQRDTAGVKIKMPDNVVFVKDDINGNGGLVEYNEDKNRMTFKKSDALTMQKVKEGDILYSLPVEGIAPEGYVVKVTKVIEEGDKITYEIEPSTLFEAFDELQETVPVLLDEMTENNIVFYDPLSQIDDDVETRAGSISGKGFSWDSEKGLALKNDRYSVSINEGVITSSIIILDVDDNLKTTYDQVKLDVTLIMKPSDFDCSFEKTKSNLHFETKVEMGAKAALKYEVKMKDEKIGTMEESNTKIIEKMSKGDPAMRDMMSSLVGKKFKLFEVDIPLGAVSYVVQAKVPVFGVFRYDMDGSIVIELGYEGTQYGLAFDTNPAKVSFQKIRSAEPSVNIALKSEIEVMIGLGIGLEIKIPMVRYIEEGQTFWDFRESKKSNIGIYYEWDLIGQAKAKSTAGLIDHSSIWNLDISARLADTLYVGGTIGFLKWKYNIDELKWGWGRIFLDKELWSTSLSSARPTPYQPTPTDKSELGKTDKYELSWRSDRSDIPNAVFDLYMGTDSLSVAKKKMQSLVAKGLIDTKYTFVPTSTKNGNLTSGAGGAGGGTRTWGGTTYYWKVDARTLSGKSYSGDTWKFSVGDGDTPASDLPQLASPTFDGGSFSVNIVSSGGCGIDKGQSGFIYSLSKDEINQKKGTRVTAASVGKDFFKTSKVVGLQPGTTYYAVAYAANCKGTAYSGVFPFTTEAEKTGPVASLANGSECNFGKAVAGTSTSKYIYIKNAGNADLHVTSVTLSNVDGDAFALEDSGDWKLPLSPGKTRGVRVKFSPKKIGESYSALLTVDSDDRDGVRRMFQLSGEGIEEPAVPVVPVNPVPQRGISLSPESLDFGGVAVGVEAVKEFTITNTGNGQLRVSRIMVNIANTSTPSQNYTVDWNGGDIPAGGNRTVKVTFKPANAADYPAQIYIYNTARNVSVVSLTGTGKAAADAKPKIVVPQGSVDFGDVKVGGFSERTIEIQNRGDNILNVTNISLPVGFSIVNWPSGTIAAGGRQGVVVRFSPTAVQGYSGDMVIDSNDGQRKVALTGRGSNVATPVISVSPISLDFGEVDVNGTKILSIQISNTGGAALNILSVNIAGADTAGFTADYAGGTIAAQTSIVMNVTFKPAKSGAHSALVSINSDASNSSNTVVSLTGTGKAATPPTPSVNITWVDISAGTFMMGSPDSELGRSSNEAQHQVTLSAFKMSAHPITNAQYDVFCEATGRAKPASPSWRRLGGPRRLLPECVPVRLLSLHQIHQHRLPCCPSLSFGSGCSVHLSSSVELLPQRRE